jgi:hypothetical protein
LLLSSVFDLDLHEAGDLCAANRAFISLHAYDLTALNAQAHVSTGEYDRVLGHSETYHALSLGLISYVGCRVIYAVDVIQLEDRVVVLYIFENA